VDIAPGLGYWQVDDALPGPGIERVGAIHNLLISGGLDWQLGGGWRVATEFTDVHQSDVEIGLSVRAGYAALFKSVDRVTGYVSASRMLSGARGRELRRQLTTELLPPGIPGGDQINAVQSLAGEGLKAFDQSTVALGLSYALTPSSRLKAEWARTHIGSVSTMADPGPGTAPPAHTRVDVLSVSYSIAF
jgi:hypothetical protein